MSYYIKISYRNKMKKFIVKDSKLINLSQIKNSFIPHIPMNAKLNFNILCPTQKQFKFTSEE